MNKFNLYIPFHLWAEISVDNFEKLEPYLDCTLEEFKEELDDPDLKKDNITSLEFDICGEELSRAIHDGNLSIGTGIMEADWTEYASVGYDGFDRSMVCISPRYDRNCPNYLTFDIETELPIDKEVVVLDWHGQPVNMTLKEAVKDYIQGQMSDGIGEGDQGDCFLNGETLYISFGFNVEDNIE